MGDTKIDYDEKFGMNTFKREICNVMGEKFWDALTENLSLPDIEMECSCQCRNMFAFLRRRPVRKQYKRFSTGYGMGCILPSRRGHEKSF